MNPVVSALVDGGPDFSPRPLKNLLSFWVTVAQFVSGLHDDQVSCTWPVSVQSTEVCLGCGGQ